MEKICIFNTGGELDRVVFALAGPASALAETKLSVHRNMRSNILRLKLKHHSAHHDFNVFLKYLK